MIEILDTEAALEALALEWSALWQAQADASPFSSPAWLLPWWRQFGTGLPLVATRRRAGRLCGVLPLYILPDEGKALPIGAGTTDYLDGLGKLDGLLEAALGRLAADGITRCDLTDVPPGSALIGTAVPGWEGVWRQGTTCPVLPLPGLGARMRRKVAMSRHRAERAGGWRVQTADAAGLEAFLETLVRLHQARWQEAGEPGVLADPAALGFWHAAAPGLFAAGVLRPQVLLVDGRPAAAVASLLSPGRIYFYLGGFDPAGAFVSPGTLLFAAMLEEAAAEGRTQAHFLRGPEPYKYGWGAVDRFNLEGSYRA